jgi:hypothetical protein
MQVSKSEIRHSAQILNISPLTQTQTAQLPPTLSIRFLKLYLASSLPLPEGRAGPL